VSAGAYTNSEKRSGISARSKGGKTRRLSPNVARVVLAQVYAYSAVIPRHVRIRKHLGEHGSQRRRTVRRVARAGELELLTKEDSERGALLGCGEGDKLGDFEGRDATGASIVHKIRVIEQLSSLLYCGL
jgi:hypothetical protein